MTTSSNDRTPQAGDHRDILERNVSTLLEAGGEAPRLAEAARTRIRASLVDRLGVDKAHARRAPLYAIGLGLAATAAGALIVTRLAGDDATPTHEVATGEATWILADGAKVTELGPRHLRVEGAALVDVVPGHGSFVVDTARGRIEVVGTRFLVDAAADRTTAAVVRGSVKLASADGSVVLHAGEQGVVEPGRPPVRQPAPRLSHLVSWAAAARKQQEHAVTPIRNGTLFARDPNAPWVPESPLPIAKLGVDIVVEDQVARVALDQTFHNPQNQVLEGMYRFAIPPDASLQRLAMYVDGRLTESAVVERMRARRIYEDVVYRRLDPALLEWAGTGRLSLKVYPLPAQEDKRLVLAYTQSLPKLYDDWTLTVPLPEVDLPVGELAFDVRVKGCANCEITSPSHKISVERKGDDAIVAYRQASARIGDSLVLRVRDQRTRPISARFTEPSGERYLMLRARPELARKSSEYRRRTWVILDDVSASRDAMARRAQHDLIDGFLRELDEEDRVAIVTFDVTAREKLAPTRVLDVDRRAVRTALSAEGGVGATDFSAALDAAAKLLDGVPADDAMVVYLGDGVITSGPRQLDELRERLAGKAHFIGVGVGDGPDTQTLEALAAATAGYATTIDLADDVGWRAFDLVAALHTPRVNGITAQLLDAGGAPVPATVYVKTPQLADGEELELVAKLAGPATPVAVELTGTIAGGAPWHQRVALADDAHDGGYLPRMWAQRHIEARLLAKHEKVTAPPCTVAAPPAVRGRPGAAAPAAPVCKTDAEARAERDEDIRKEIVALGKKYFLLSRHTSLLVLENDAMYAKYGVEKGAGDTWAPYVVPAKIPVTKTPVLVDVAPDADLIRSPLQLFANMYDGSYNGLGWNEEQRWSRDRFGTRGFGPGGGGFAARRGSLDLETAAATPAETRFTLEEGRSAGREATRLEEAKKESDNDKSDDITISASAPVGNVTSSDEGEAGEGTVDQPPAASEVFAGSDSGGGLADGRFTGKLGGASLGPLHANKNLEYAQPNIAYPQRLAYPGDQAYDDLTTFIPGLVTDGADAWRRELKVSAGGAKQHAIADRARTLLAAAHRAMPAGLYRWGELEIAVDANGRMGWRRTTGADLAETTSFDGTTWLRRYPELGLDVTRTVGDDDVALALAYLPIWIAEPAHYARWFEVGSPSAREVTLSRRVGRGKTELAYTLEFDTKSRLVAIRDAGNTEVLAVTWGAVGPARASVDGTELAVGYSASPVTDAVGWAHGAGAGRVVVVEMPMKLVAFWDAKLAKLDAGSPAWRHAQRQRMASLAATNQRGELAKAIDALAKTNELELGDVVLASGGLAAATPEQFTRVASLSSVKDSTVIGYLRASRDYARTNEPQRIVARTGAGFVGALWTLREVTALLAADKNGPAIDKLMTLGQRAFDLRLVGASASGQRYRMKPADVIRAWDSVAIGEYKNIARAQAAQVLANRGLYDASAERIAALVNDLDLEAYPPNLAQLRYQFTNSRRGNAGWQLVWATWRDRVLASTSYPHVMSLLPLAGMHPMDTQAILARAVALAGDDAARVLQVARIAMSLGQTAFGTSLIEPMVTKHPTRELLQLAANLALAQGRPADALDHLEKAQTLDRDDTVALTTLRAELAQIINLARQLAVQSQGAAREKAVARALDWGRRWRAIDPGNPQIDSQLGELLLAVGNTAEAWRQLSSVIERDPMSGDGYQTVAQAFETQGRVAEAVAYWHQAVIIDQTNPTPRLREAQALIALGRTAEGDALLQQIVNRKWHVRWDGVVYQVRSMIERGKTPVGMSWDE